MEEDIIMQRTINVYFLGSKVNKNSKEKHEKLKTNFLFKKNQSSQNPCENYPSKKL